MRRLLLLAGCLAALALRAGAFDAKKAPFLELFDESLRAGDSPEHLASRNAAYAELMARGPETLSNLMERIHVENPMIGVYAIGMTADRPMPVEQALPVLASFYAAERPVTRKMAAYLSSFYRAPQYADRVLPLLGHEKTRGAAVRALGKWQVTNALPRLLECLRDGKERVRVLSANALRDVGDPRAVPALIGAVGDPVFTVRNAAARALVGFGDAAKQPALAALDASRDETARRQLVRVLGDLRHPGALASLRSLAEGGHAGLADDARRSIALIDGRREDPWFVPGGD